MELYLVQHSESKSKEEDPERGLSDHGFANIRKMAAYAKKLNISVENIYYSNKLRARQTAEELAKTVIPAMGLKQREDIAPMDNVTSIKDEIKTRENSLMIIGHLPFMNKLASALLCEDEEKNIVSFLNGCIVKLSKNDETNAWSLKWMITPEIIKI